jgi:CBS domain-containing protein
MNKTGRGAKNRPPELYYTEEELEQLEYLDMKTPQRGALHEMLLEDPISQLNVPKPIVLQVSDPVSLAAKLMSKFRYGSVLVLDDEWLAGIFTERDLLLRCADKDLDRLKLSEVMTREPQALREDDTLACALNLMSVGGYRHVPIMRDGHLIGFLSVRGILRYLADNALAPRDGALAPREAK